MSRLTTLVLTVGVFAMSVGVPSAADKARLP